VIGLSRTRYLLILLLTVVGCAVLVVLSRSADVRDAVALCKESANKELCYATEIESTLKKRGIPAAFDALSYAYDNDRDFSATCHALTHELGAAAYETFRETGDTELTSKAWYCGYGYYHGFLDALMIDTNDISGAREFCAYIGKNVPHPPPPEFAEGSCYHGIGHGITDGTDPRLWGDDLVIAQPGLALCESVAQGNVVWQKRCSSGVFNAIGNMYFDAKYKLEPGPDPYSLCKRGGFSRVDAESCYSQMNTQAAALGRNDLSKIIAFTRTIRDREYRAAALKEASSYYIQTLKQRDRDLSASDIETCAKEDAYEAGICIDGLIGGVYEFGAPNAQYEEALAACAAADVSSTFGARCYSHVLAMSHFFYDESVQRTVCSHVPEPYSKACVS
jgi:hypothetical protein